MTRAFAAQTLRQKRKLLHPSTSTNRQVGRQEVSLHCGVTTLFRLLFNLEVLESEAQPIVTCIQKKKTKTCLQAGSSFLSCNCCETRHKITLLLTGSGSGELEEQMAVGGWIFLLSPGAALERTGAMVLLSDSAELTVNFTIFFDDFSRLIN